MEGFLQWIQQPGTIYSPSPVVCAAPPSTGFLFPGLAPVRSPEFLSIAACKGMVRGSHPRAGLQESWKSWGALWLLPNPQPLGATPLLRGLQPTLPAAQEHGHLPWPWSHEQDSLQQPGGIHSPAQNFLPPVRSSHSSQQAANGLPRAGKLGSGFMNSKVNKKAAC